MPCGLLSRAPVPWRVAHLPEEHKAGNEPSSATAINGAAAEESVNLPDQGETKVVTKCSLMYSTGWKVFQGLK